RFGPKRMIAAGALLTAVAWCLNSAADPLALLYFAQTVGGCGAGMVYGTCIGTALKWFPDRRGLAAGLMAAAFGAGAALTVAPIRWTILRHGYDQAFLWFGLGQALVIIVAALIVRFPRPGEPPAAVQSKVLQPAR